MVSQTIESTPHPVDKIVGARIRIRRREVKLSQDDLAKALGLTFQQVQKYEKGGNRVSASKLYETAKILQVPISFFFDDLPDPVTGEGGSAIGGVTAALSNSDVMDVITWMAALDAGEKRLVRNLAGGLLRMREGRGEPVLATTLVEQPVQALLAAPESSGDVRRGRAKTPGRIIIDKLASGPIGGEEKVAGWMHGSVHALNQMLYAVGGPSWCEVKPDGAGFKLKKVTEPR